MDTTASPDSAGTVAVESSASASVPCLLNGLPSDAHQYIHALEERLRVVENALRENHERTKAMGTMIFNNPATKIFLAALPKEAQLKLKEMFGGSNSVTEKSNGNGNP